MKIYISKEGLHYLVAIENDCNHIVVIDDEAHSNLGEAEAKARAAALHGATGWPVTLEYELD